MEEALRSKNDTNLRSIMDDLEFPKRELDQTELEKEDQSRMLSIEKSLEEWIQKFDESVPDPIVSTNYLIFVSIYN